MAALAQNGDGLRADQAGAADDDDLHGFTSLVDGWRPQWVRLRFSDARFNRSNVQIGIDRIMPIPNRAVLFSTRRAAAPREYRADALTLRAAVVSVRSGRVVAFRRRPFMLQRVRHDRAKQQARSDRCATRKCRLPHDAKSAAGHRRPDAATAEAKACGRCARCCCPGSSPRVRHPVGRGDAQHRLHGRRLS